MGTGALSLGATDFVFSGRERIDPMFLERTNEEGKTGKSLPLLGLQTKLNLEKKVH